MTWSVMNRGLFSIGGIKPVQVNVAVSKPGYDQFKPDDTTVMSHGSFGQSSYSSKESPLVFRLLKAGPRRASSAEAMMDSRKT